MGATERDEAARAAWREQSRQLEASGLVFVDECGSNISLTPVYARAAKRRRAVGSMPRNRGANTTLIASLSLEGMGAAMIPEGATTGLAFELYVEQFLAPSLQAGQIVVMDNLQAHKRASGRQAIEARGCQLWFLPAYSPDLSPIEETFSKRDPPFSVGWERALGRRWKRRSARASTPSPHKMLVAGLAIAATYL